MVMIEPLPAGFYSNCRGAINPWSGAAVFERESINFSAALVE